MSTHGPEFFETEMGRRFYQVTMPEISRNLKSLSDSMETVKTILSKKQDTPENSSGIDEKALIFNLINQTEDMLSEYGIILPRSLAEQRRVHIPEDEMQSITGEDYKELAERFRSVL